MAAKRSSSRRGVRKSSKKGSRRASRKGGKKGGSKYLSKSQVYEALVHKSEVDKKVVKRVMENFVDLLQDELRKKKMFMLHGVAKFVVKHRPARKAKKGINPFTREPCVFKARPACKLVRARVAKACKDSVN